MIAILSLKCVGKIFLIFLFSLISRMGCHSQNEKFDLKSELLICNTTHLPFYFPSLYTRHSLFKKKYLEINTNEYTLAGDTIILIYSRKPVKNHPSVMIDGYYNDLEVDSGKIYSFPVIIRNLPASFKKIKSDLIFKIVYDTSCFYFYHSQERIWVYFSCA